MVFGPHSAVSFPASYRFISFVLHSVLDHGLRLGLLQSKLQREALLLGTRGRLIPCLSHKQRQNVRCLFLFCTTLCSFFYTKAR